MRLMKTQTFALLSRHPINIMVYHVVTGIWSTCRIDAATSLHCFSGLHAQRSAARKRPHLRLGDLVRLPRASTGRGSAARNSLRICAARLCVGRRCRGKQRRALRCGRRTNCATRLALHATRRVASSQKPSARTHLPHPPMCARQHAHEEVPAAPAQLPSAGWGWAAARKEGHDMCFGNINPKPKP